MATDPKSNFLQLAKQYIAHAALPIKFVVGIITTLASLAGIYSALPSHVQDSILLSVNLITPTPYVETLVPLATVTAASSTPTLDADEEQNLFDSQTATRVMVERTQVARRLTIAALIAENTRLAPTWTPTPTATFTATPTQTETATITPSSTPTSNPLPTATDTATPTVTSTTTPTLRLTATLPPTLIHVFTPTLQPTPTLIRAYPCEGRIPIGIGTRLDQVFTSPFRNSPRRPAVLRGSTVTVTQQPHTEMGETWYYIEYDRGSGWIQSEYIEVDQNCP